MMKTFQIEISETLSQILDIQAENLHDAIKIAKEKYRNEEIVLTESDFVQVEFLEHKDE